MRERIEEIQQNRDKHVSPRKQWAVPDTPISLKEGEATAVIKEGNNMITYSDDVTVLRYYI